jgi:hypothetical protein
VCETAFATTWGGEDTDASDFWAEASSHRDELAACVDARHAELAAWHRAAAAPTFVPTDGQGDVTLHAHFLFQTVVMSALVHALEGRWHDADREIADLLRMTSEALETTPNSFAALLASDSLEQGLEVAHFLSQQYGWSRFPKLAAQLSSMDEVPDAERVLERLEFYRYAQLRESIEEFRGSLSGAEKWTFDPVHSAELVDARLTRFMLDHGGGVLGSGDTTEADCGGIARLHNSYGCKLYGPQTWDNSPTEDQLNESHQAQVRWLRRLRDSLQASRPKP